MRTERFTTRAQEAILAGDGIGASASAAVGPPETPHRQDQPPDVLPAGNRHLPSAVVLGGLGKAIPVAAAGC